MVRFLPDPALLDSPRTARFLDPTYTNNPSQGKIPDTTTICIIGAGPAGISLAVDLWHQTGTLDDIILLDACGLPFAQWSDRINALGQRTLRSPYEHHMGTQGHRDCELLDFARCHWSHLTSIERAEVRMAMSGQRSVVPLDIFEAYATFTTSIHGIDARIHRSRVTQVDLEPDGMWSISHDSGQVRARAVVFAVGEDVVQPPSTWQYPSSKWDTFKLRDTTQHLVVSGSGLSAAHLIANACNLGVSVSWVQRRAERYQCADVNARFFRPEGRAAFRRLSVEGRRRALIQHRDPSIMWEFKPKLESWSESGLLTVRRHAVIQEVRSGDCQVEVSLTSGETFVADQLVAAHGTRPARLPLAGLGDVPALDENCGIVGNNKMYVLGAHAGMTVGPAARNLDGMRVAAAYVARELHEIREWSGN